MVALEPGEPLLLYNAVTVEVISMVLFMERLELHQLQEPKGSTAGSLGSQDPKPMEEARAKEVVGS
jgi:hypothetical protein